MHQTGPNPTLVVICALAGMILIVLPAAAANSSISIGYSGPGGNYIGDMIFFSGTFTGGDTVELRISGPGLPAGGVPVNNLDGQPGAGTPIEVSPGGTWKFLWYSGYAQGVGKLQTARYTFTIQDPANSSISSKTSLVLKKPEFSASVSPDPSVPEEYVDITGVAEQGVSLVTIAVADGNGKVFHTFTAPVSADGYFNFGFHVDMPPGQYSVTVSHPSSQAVLTIPMTVVSSRASANATAGPSPNQTVLGENGAGNTTGVPGAGTSGQAANLSPALIRGLPFTPLPPATAVLALVLAACGIGILSVRKRT
ncbi:MAG TPA: hypothetical protein VEI81_04420 [Methanoregula sp.]|nr:hypothetical protein [Methanoregula sp.]